MSLREIFEDISHIVTAAVGVPSPVRFPDLKGVIFYPEDESACDALIAAKECGALSTSIEALRGASPDDWDLSVLQDEDGQMILRGAKGKEKLEVVLGDKFVQRRNVLDLAL